MRRSGSSGCRKAAVIFAGVVLIALMLLLGVLWMFSSKRDEARERARAAAERESAALADAGPIMIREGDWDSLAPLREGEAVDVKHFILMMEDPRATDLARETFRQRADGAPVTWRMTLQEVREESGSIRAEFAVPYTVEIPGGRSGGSLRPVGEFDESQRDALVALRRGDRVTVSGTLALDGERVGISGAVVGGE